MTGDRALERRYRRLLAWYPAAHRSSHGEEMIGVLMASAGDGQRAPRPADALDLIAGGLRIRLRAALAWRPGQDSRDALAVFSVCMPAIWIISNLAVALATDVTRAARAGDLRVMLILTGYSVVEAIIMAVPVVLGWRGHPRTGATIAAILAGLLAYLAFGQPFGAGVYASYSLLLAWEAAALVASDGPRRGAAVMTRRSWLVATGAGLAIASWQAVFFVGYNLTVVREPGFRVAAAVLIAVAVTAGFLLTLPRPVAGRLLVLFAVPAWLVLAGSLLPGIGVWYWAIIAVSFLPALGLATITFAGGLAARWRGRGPQAADG